MKINEFIQQAISGTIDENKVLYDHYVEELNSLLEAKVSILKLEADLRIKIAKYSPKASQTPVRVAQASVVDGTNDYPIKGSWADKAEYFLRKTSDLTGKEILTLIEESQPELKGKIASSVYPTLSDHSKDGKRFVKEFDSALKVNKFRMRT